MRKWKSIVIRSSGLLFFTLALMAQFVESGDTKLAAHLQLAIEPLMPARVYLVKDGQPFRLSPVQAQLSLQR
jgi:hypothetical protein